MRYEAIDSVLLATPNLDDACRLHERLGLILSPVCDKRRYLHVGDASNLFTIEFVTPDDPWSAFAGQTTSGSGLVAVVLRVSDLDMALGELKARAIDFSRLPDHCDRRAAWLALNQKAGTDLILVQSSEPLRERHAAAIQHGLLGHALPLVRLDHLAVVTHDLEEKTRFWADVLGVAVAGEVITPTMVIRQLKIADAVLELLGPVSSDSPIWKRSPGLVNVASWQVADLDSTIAHVRAAGFSVPDPVIGVLPRTRVSTVQGSELAGVNLQLLQYV